MWSERIVLQPPILDDLFCFRECLEIMLIEALVPQPTVEALNKRVLHGLAGLDEVDSDMVIVCPAVERNTREFRPIIGRYDLRAASRQNEPIEYSRYSLAVDRRIDFNSKALFGEDIKDREGFDLPAVPEAIRYEVHRPALVGSRCFRQFHADRRCPLVALARLEREVVLSVNTLGALMVLHELLAAQHLVEYG